MDGGGRPRPTDRTLVPTDIIHRMPELRYYRYFAAVAQMGSIKAAAKFLHVTPSTLSEQIAVLERQLGVRLLDRGRHGARLTVSGEVMLPGTIQLLEDERALQHSIDAYRRQDGDRIKIGTIVGPTTSWMPPALTEFMYSDKGKTRLFIDIYPVRDIVRLTADGDLDVGIISTSASEPWIDFKGLARRTLIEDKVLLYAQAGKLSSITGKINPSEVADERFVVFPHGYIMREMVDRWFDSHGVNLNLAAEVSFAPLAVSLVRAGIGLALLPESSGSSVEMEGIDAFEVSSPLSDGRSVSALYRRDNNHLSDIIRMADLLKRHARAYLLALHA
jgi:DNA-binding transcriptional LysR family regulator